MHKGALRDIKARKLSNVLLREVGGGGGGGGGGGTMLYVYANFEHETLTCVTNTPHIIS